MKVLYVYSYGVLRYLRGFPSNKGVITWLNGKWFKMHDIPKGSAEVRMFSLEMDNYYKAPHLRLDTGFGHQSNRGLVNGRGVSR